MQVESGNYYRRTTGEIVFTKCIPFHNEAGQHVVFVTMEGVGDTTICVSSITSYAEDNTLKILGRLDSRLQQVERKLAELSP